MDRASMHTAFMESYPSAIGSERLQPSRQAELSRRRWTLIKGVHLLFLYACCFAIPRVSQIIDAVHPSLPIWRPLRDSAFYQFKSSHYFFVPL